MLHTMKLWRKSAIGIFWNGWRHFWTQVENDANKKTVARYIDGFNKLDHAQILSCLRDDVVWDMPGFFRHIGKEAFDKEIENEAFEGKPVITLTRMTEENDVVIAEGSVQAKRKNGPVLSLVFCDVFEMQSGKIQKLIGFIAERKES